LAIPAASGICDGKAGIDVATEKLKSEEGITFNIPIEQKARPGLKGALRIEARPWG